MTDPLLAIPLVTVEVAFEVDAAKQSIHSDYDTLTWTDITDWVRAGESLTFNRGRALVGESASAGQLTVSVNNTDGRFTPAVTGGVFGRITTMMPIRVRGYTIEAVEGTGPYGPEYGTDYDTTALDVIELWTGFVTDVEWKIDGGQPVVTFQAVDIVGAAARIRCMAWLTGRVLSQDRHLYNYWPLTDLAAVTECASGLIPAGDPATVTGTLGDLVTGVESDLSPDGDTVAALTPSGVDYKTLNASFTAGGTAGGWTLGDPLLSVLGETTIPQPASGDLAVSGWVRCTTRPGGLVTMTSDGDTILAVAISSTGRVVVTEDGVSGTYGSSSLVDVGTWTHIYVEKDHSETGTFAARFRVWVDGVEASLTSGGASVSAAAPATTTVVIGHATDPLDGQIGHVAIFNTITGTDVRAQLLADNGTSAPTAHERFLELPYLVPRQAATLGSWLTGDATATTTMSAQTTTGKTLLDVANEIAAADRGQVVGLGNGHLALISAGSRVPSTTPAITVSADTDVLAFDGAFSIDDAESYDTAQVTMQPSGVVYSAKSSATDPGLQSYTADLWVTDGNQAQAVANAAVTSATDVPRSPRLSLSMDWLTHAGLADDMLNVELGSLIHVGDLPATAPASFLNLTVESVEYSIDASGWTVSVDTGTAGGWKLGDPVLSVLGDTTILQL